MNPKIVAALDYVIQVEGRFEYQQNQVFTIRNKPNFRAMVISATTDTGFLIVDAANADFEIGDEIIPTNSDNNVKTTKQYFGNIIDIDGNILYPKKYKPEFQANSLSSNAFATSRNLLEVNRLNEQLYTGIMAIDLLMPIGKGQRELIIGDRGTGKTHIVLNAIINQTIRKTNVKCIYVSIGQKRQNVADVYETLKKHGALENTIIIDAPATNSYHQYLAPYVAMAHAENISHFQDVLVIFDDLTKHANIYREMSLLVNRTVGKEAFPGDIFFSHASVLERAGKFADRKSITCLPIVKTVNNDITSLISSNLISITDGQIVTNTDLFANGILPAINIDLSVSRLGSSVQSSVIAKVASQINKKYRAYKRQSKLWTLKYDLNEETADLISKGKAIEQLFIQKGFAPYTERFMLLITKLILWGTLRKVDNKAQEALSFINALIDTDPIAKWIYDHLESGQDFNDDLMRNFFEYSLSQYFKYKNYDLQIDVDKKFIDFKPEELQAIVNNMKGAL
ncbi:F0F1 ATP synthase subunit alpha [Mycoplasmoides gallisepticum S6]|uniref:F0F1 ATP synthase subunit alpha n=1 Tax=Mycoplasmoides gallisepticum S6 TaxID=1006581 RepID=A0A0F6CLD7_MYCGL|nr:ATP F0F1 synthase subunit alpha [Mycoplasmoides gallisepticum]AHB99909.1 F0F1 ATP synthase subunit alpha [Mycoplasmoides gallisepticum S6]